MLPVLGKMSKPGDPKEFFVCYKLEDVHRAGRQGATHFVKCMRDSREFRVHVVAPNVIVHQSKAKDYQVVKISERINIGVSKKLKNFIPRNKKEEPGYYFSKPVDVDKKLLNDLHVCAQNALKELLLHWGTISFLVGTDGIPKITKIDSHISLVEDQSNTIAKMSNAFCKMLGENPLPIVRRKPRRHVSTT